MASREPPPSGRSEDGVESSVGYPLYLSYTSFAPPGSSFSGELERSSYSHQKSHQQPHHILRSNYSPIVPTETHIYPPPRLFRNQSPPSIPWESARWQSPKQPNRKNSPTSSPELLGNHTTNHQQGGITRIPLRQLQKNDTNKLLFDNGYSGSGKIEDVRRQIVDQYIVTRKNEDSVDSAVPSPSVLPDGELELTLNNRRLSSLTMQSNVAPRAPGEDSCLESVPPRGHIVPHHPINDQGLEATPQKVYTKQAPPKLHHKIYDPFSSIYNPEKDMEVSTSPSHHQNEKRSSRRPTFKSFSSFRSDERSKSSQKTVKTLLSAKFAVVLPSRRSSSAIQPRIEPLEEEEQEENKMTTRFFSVSACLCILMILAAILFVIFVPRGAASGKLGRPKKPHRRVDDGPRPPGGDPFASSKNEPFQHNNHVDKGLDHLPAE